MRPSLFGREIICSGKWSEEEEEREGDGWGRGVKTGGGKGWSDRRRERRSLIARAGSSSPGLYISRTGAAGAPCSGRRRPGRPASPKVAEEGDRQEWSAC